MEEEHWASFGEHISELRQTILRSLFIVGMGFVIIFAFYQPLLQLLTSYPLEQTESGLLIRKVQQNQVTNQTNHLHLFELPFQAHLISEITPFKQKDGHFYYQLAPGQSLLYKQTLQTPLLIIGPLEGLVLVFKVCLWISLALTAPFWGFAWLQFVLPGLKAQERSILVPFLLGSFLSVLIGITFAYYITLPLSTRYLTFFNSSIGQNAWTLTHFVNYVLWICLGHAMMAELGLLLFLLVHFRFLSPKELIAKRRYMIVLAFILGALLTPPDVLTQLLLALPLIVLYELAIWYARWRQRSTRTLLNLSRSGNHLL